MNSVLPACALALLSLTVLRGGESGWTPKIGDPSFMGWLTVVGYVSAAAYSAILAKKCRHSPELGEFPGRFWVLLAVALTFLGANKQLDLQGVITGPLKRLALEQGWYESRRIYQALFIGAIAAGGLLVTLAIGRAASSQEPSLRLPIIGMAILFTFVTVRAAAFHHVDALIGFEFGGMRMNWILELGGILLVLCGAHTYRRRLVERLVRAS